jgi:hypothetical protein
MLNRNANDTNQTAVRSVNKSHGSGELLTLARMFGEGRLRLP